MIKGFKSKLRLFGSTETETETETKILFGVPEKNGFHHIRAPEKPPPDRLKDQQEVLLEKLLSGSKKKTLKEKNSKNLEAKAEVKPKTETVVVVERNNNTNNSSNAIGNNVNDVNNVNNVNNVDNVNVKKNSQSLKPDADPITCNNGGNPEENEGRDSIDDLPESERPHPTPSPTSAYAESCNSSEAADKITPIAEGPLAGPGLTGAGCLKDPPRRCQSQRENRAVNPRLRKFSVPTTMEEHGLQGHR